MSKTSEDSIRCSFCGREKKEVNVLIAGITGHICDSCITQAHLIAVSYTHLTLPTKA